MDPTGPIPRRDMLTITAGPVDRPPGSPLRGRNKGSVKGKLMRQTTVESEKRAIPKQESKDSGIVTEMMSTRPKELKDTKDVQPQGRTAANVIDPLSSPRRNGGGSLKSPKKNSVKVKRSFSVKEKNSRSTEFRDMHDSSSLELLTTKQNGVLDDGEADNEKKTASSIRGMWKKAVKSLKSSSSEPKLFKKGSLYKKKQNSKEEEEQAPVSSGAVDPVYSLLKCAQDLPKSAGGTGSGSGSSVGGGKSPCMAHPQCSGHPSSDQRYMRYPSGGDSSGNTSKTSSPSSSGPLPSTMTTKVAKASSSKHGGADPVSNRTRQPRDT